MRSRPTRLAALVLLTLPTALAAQAKPATSHSTKPDRKADAAAIREIDRKWVAAVAARDTAYIARVYAADAVALPPNADKAEGRAAIAKTWAAMATAPGVKLTFEPATIDFSRAGDLAYETGTYTYEQDNPKGGDKIRDHGKYVVVWAKQDGRWQVMRDIWNSDVPMPSM
ncbi:MAG TPA: SgcJ/EcaC family oxidoreductase [Gemmatimonadales bacterium]|nr:SgcJ/EcaC family oxidoreductase [Gemmatimonadales bacterium]